MASLKEATGAVTDRLEDLVGRLRTELQDGGGDFEKLSGLADQISEAADGLADAFSNVNEQLMERLDQLKSGGSGNGSSSGSRRKAAKTAGGE